MLPPAALHVADRLITTLMTLLRAVAPRALAPTLPEAAKQTLFFRLSRLVTHLIHISNFGVRGLATPKPATQAPDRQPSPAPHRRPTRRMATAGLPRRPGWLLAALPEIAPSIAADLQALLADPAIATVLHTAPTLHRALRPLLRGLGLDAAPPNPTAPPPPPPSAPAPNPTARPHRTSKPPLHGAASQFALLGAEPLHALCVLI